MWFCEKIGGESEQKRRMQLGAVAIMNKKDDGGWLQC